MNRHTNLYRKVEDYQSPNSVTRQFEYRKDSHRDRKDMSDLKNPQQARVYQIQNSTFKAAISPILSKEKKDLIEQKLELQRKASSGTAERIKSENLFVKYYSNPFIQTRQAQQWKNPSQQLDEDEPQIAQFNKNIVSAVNMMKIRPINKFQTAQFASNKNHFEKISLMNQKITHFHQNQQIRTTSDKFKDKQMQTSFDEILSQPQKRFIPTKFDNLFRVTDPKFYPISTSQLLHNNYFHWNSNINYNSKYRLPFETHLSVGSRMSALKKAMAEPEPIEANINLESITFHNIMGVASGRLTSNAVYSANHGQSLDYEDASQKSTQIQSRQIQYPENTCNIAINHFDDNLDRDEIREYLKLSQLSKDEQMSLKKYEKLSQMIKSQILTRNDAVKTKINDKRLHAELKGKINEDISRLMSTDEVKDWQTDKIILRNKQHKDHKTNMRNNFVIESLQQKKQSDRVINEMLKNISDKKTK